MFIVHVAEAGFTSTSDLHPAHIALRLAKAWEENGRLFVVIRTANGTQEWTPDEFRQGSGGDHVEGFGDAMG